MQVDMVKELIMMYKNDGFKDIDIELTTNEVVSISGNYRVQTRGKWIVLLFDYYVLQILSDYIARITV